MIGLKRKNLRPAIKEVALASSRKVLREGTIPCLCTFCTNVSAYGL
jgi:hypothetical protein